MSFTPFDPIKSLEKHLGEYQFNSRMPFYNDSSDYTTNAPSYYDDLARKNKLIKHLALRIWEYDEELKKRFKAWDKNLEEFDDEVLRLLKEWMDNGRFDEIINEHIFGDLNDKLEQVIYKTGVGINDYINGQGIETVKFQNALNINAGKRIIIPPEMEITLDDTITIPADTEIYGYGSKIVFTNESESFKLNNNGCIKGVTFEGNGVFNLNSKAIDIVGNVGVYKHSICIEDCTFENVGGFGINMMFVKDVNINNCKFYDIGYAGIQGSSVTNVIVNGGHIKGVWGHSSNANCYGVAFTRSGLDNSLSVYPRSKDCSVIDMTVEDIPKWEGLDTHAGENIVFKGNTIKNCGTGIAIVNSHYQGTQDHEPRHCRVLDNTIYGTGRGAGISMAGNVSTLSDGNIISNNTLIDCGEIGNNIRGAIRLIYTRGLIITGNTIIKPHEIGVNMYNRNENVIVNDNTIIDPHSATWGATCHVSTREAGNSAILSGNQFLRKQTDLNTYVAQRSLYMPNNDSNTVNMDNNMDQSERGATGNYYSLKEVVDRLIPSEIVKYDIDRGYTIQLAQGLTLTWQSVTVDPTSTEVQHIPYPQGALTSGNIGGSVTLDNTHNQRTHDDYNRMSVSTTVDGWKVMFSEGESTVTELGIRLFAIGMTL